MWLLLHLQNDDDEATLIQMVPFEFIVLANDAGSNRVMWEVERHQIGKAGNDNVQLVWNTYLESQFRYVVSYLASD